VAENCQRPRAFDLPDLAGLQREILEEWRLLNVSAFVIPLIRIAGARGDFVPLRVLSGEILVKLPKHFRLQGGLHEITQLAEVRPDVSKKNRLAVFASTEGLG